MIHVFVSSIYHLLYIMQSAYQVIGYVFFINIFIDYAITVVPFSPLHSTPSCPPPPSHIPPL